MQRSNKEAFLSAIFHTSFMNSSKGNDTMMLVLQLLRHQQSWHGEKHHLHPSQSPLSSQQNGRSSLGLQSAPLDGSNTDDQQGNKIAKVPFLSWFISQTTKRTHPDKGLPTGGRYGQCSSTKQGKHSNLRGCCDRRIS